MPPEQEVKTNNQAITPRQESREMLLADSEIVKFEKRLSTSYLQLSATLKEIQRRRSEQLKALESGLRLVSGEVAAIGKALDAEIVLARTQTAQTVELGAVFRSALTLYAKAGETTDAKKKNALLQQSTELLTSYKSSVKAGSDMPFRQESDRLLRKHQQNIDAALVGTELVRDGAGASGAVSALALIAGNSPQGSAITATALGTSVLVGGGASLIINSAEAVLNELYGTRQTSNPLTEVLQNTANETADAAIATVAVATGIKYAGATAQTMRTMERIAKNAPASIASGAVSSLLYQAKQSSVNVANGMPLLQSLPPYDEFLTNLALSTATAGIGGVSGSASALTNNALGATRFTSVALGQTSAPREAARLLAKAGVTTLDIGADLLTTYGSARARNAISPSDSAQPDLMQNLLTVLSGRGTAYLTANRAIQEKKKVLFPDQNKLRTSPTDFVDTLTDLPTRAALLHPEGIQKHLDLAPGGHKLFRLGGDEFALVYKSKEGKLLVGSIDFDNVGAANDFGMGRQVDVVLSKLKEIAAETVPKAPNAEKAIEGFVSAVRQARDKEFGNNPAIQDAAHYAQVRSDMKKILATHTTATKGSPSTEGYVAQINQTYAERTGRDFTSDYATVAERLNSEFNAGLPLTYANAKAEQLALALSLATVKPTSGNPLMGISVGMVDVGPNPTHLEINKALAQAERNMNRAKANGLVSLPIEKLSPDIKLRQADSLAIEEAAVAMNEAKKLDEMATNPTWSADNLATQYKITLGKDANSTLARLANVSHLQAKAFLGIDNPTTVSVVQVDLTGFGAINHISGARGDAVYRKMVAVAQQQFGSKATGLRMDGGSMYLFLDAPPSITKLDALKRKVDDVVTTELRGAGSDIPISLQLEYSQRQALAHWMNKPNWGRSLGKTETSVRHLVLAPGDTMEGVMKKVAATAPTFLLPAK